MPKYFDIHSHLNFKDYEQDFEEVIARLRETETHTIVVGTDLESSQRAVDLADMYPEIYACVGVHPVDNPSRVFARDEFEKLVSHPKVVAVGECGLDFYHQDKSRDFDRQKKLFLDQLEFAVAHNKPLMIHARPARLLGDGDAYEELLEILEPLKEVHGPNLKGNIHFFAGSKEVSERFFKLDFTISFTGVITFVRDYDEVIENAPLEKILSETDAPFVAPVPHRGKRNEPSFVSEVVKAIARIRGEDLEQVRKTLVNNALSMLG